jgi:hypothetical protein
MPDKAQVRALISEVVLAVAVETVLARIARRLKYGRPCPDCGARHAGHRPVRRLLGAVVHELGAESANGVALRRFRVRAAVDRMVDNQVDRARQPGQVPIPEQRHAPDELYTELDTSTSFGPATPSGR